MFRDASHLAEIADKIGMPCEVVETTGIGYGVYIRYKTFYLRADDNDKTVAYRIRGYRYNENEPVFDYVVPCAELSKFTDQIRRDDYLNDPVVKAWSDPPEFSGPKIY